MRCREGRCELAAGRKGERIEADSTQTTDHGLLQVRPLLHVVAEDPQRGRHARQGPIGVERASPSLHSIASADTVRRARRRKGAGEARAHEQHERAQRGRHGVWWINKSPLHYFYKSIARFQVFQIQSHASVVAFVVALGLRGVLVLFRSLFFSGLRTLELM